MFSTGPTLTQQATSLLDDIRQDAYQRRDIAIEQGDLAAWLHASTVLELHKEVSSVQWILQMDGFEDYSATDFIAEQYGEENCTRYLKEAGRLSDLYTQLKEVSDNGVLPPTTDHAQVLLKRFRDSGSIEYKVLAILPPGSKQIFSSSDDHSPNVQYMVPDAACMTHACDDLYKEFREAGSQSASGTSGYIKTEHVRELYKFLNDGGSGEVEYVDPDTKEKMRNSRYVLCGLMGLFSNIRSLEVPAAVLP